MGAQHGVADGVDAAMQPVQATRRDAVGDRAPAEPKCRELPSGDDAVLSVRERRDRAVDGQ
jgi:hypothetical protein